MSTNSEFIQDSWSDPKVAKQVLESGVALNRFQKFYLRRVVVENYSVTNPEFQTHRLNEAGIAKIEEVKRLFDNLVFSFTASSLDNDGGSPFLPPGRYLSIVKTKLEEACMFAVKAVSCDPANQAREV